jgi:hypothetical protein
MSMTFGGDWFRENLLGTLLIYLVAQKRATFSGSPFLFNGLVSQQLVLMTTWPMYMALLELFFSRFTNCIDSDIEG